MAITLADVKGATRGFSLFEQIDLNKERVLVWEMPKGTKDKVEGYILYRKYTCLGQDRPATAPELISWHFDSFLIDPISEPVGCDAEYRVSAYGRAGESAPSNVVSAETASSVAIVKVSFNTVKTPKEHSSSVTLLANDYYRVSSQMYMTPTFQLNELPFDGMTGNNVIAVQLNKDDSLTLRVKLTEWDFSDRENPVETDTCDIEHTIPPPTDGWEGFQEKDTLWSGKVPDCKAEITLNGRGTVKAGKEIRPEADVQIVALTSVGRDIYVVLKNGGPDPLPSNQIKLQLKYGDEKGKPPYAILAPITRWWPPDSDNTMVKLFTFPASEDLGAMLKGKFFTVEVTPVDFIDPDNSNNKLIDETVEP